MAAHKSFAYPNPFPRNHCAVHAFEHARTKTPRASTALLLAGLARRKGILTRCGVAHVMRDIDEWCAVARVRIVEELRFPKRLVHADTQFFNHRGRYRDTRFVPTGPTVSQFCRTVGQGRWVVIVSGHVLAVVDGQPRGFWHARSRVFRAYKVEAV